MKLSQRAALLTVFLVAVIATIAVVLLIDSLPEADRGPLVELRPADDRIVTAALPRSSLHEEHAATEADTDARLAFVPRGTLSAHDLDLRPSIAQPDQASQEAPAQSWSTETRANKLPEREDGKTVLLPPVDVVARKGSAETPRLSEPPRSQSLQQRLAEISPGATVRLEEKFKAAKAAWPPAEIALLAIKDEKALEMFARSSGGAWTFVHRYPVLAASGSGGPKLTRGDKQVPEGIYGISYLNPNSRYHVSMRVNYPNTFDRRMAAKDKRRDLGNDIMIHGKKSSAGCLAMGDVAAEELFVLAAEVGVKNMKVVIAPTDFRRKGIPTALPGHPAWVPKLYMEVASAMSELKAPPPESRSLLSLLGL